MNMHLGDTSLLVEAGRERGLLRNQMAYVLATAFHETAHTMKPINEMGGDKYLRSKKYWPYIGRGYVQITWRENYVKAGKFLGVDFLSKPELLLKPEMRRQSSSLEWSKAGLPATTKAVTGLIDISPCRSPTSKALAVSSTGLTRPN